MLGTAEVPPEPLPGEPEPPRKADRDPRRVRAAAIRVVAAPPIREDSAAAAAAVVADAPIARAEVRAQLRAPHLELDEPDEPAPPVRVAADLRALVGRRDTRAPVAAALAWANQLDVRLEGTTGPELVAWAEQAGRLAAPDAPDRGDLLVFDRVFADASADLVAVVIARDERNVTEFLYLGGGVIRRGFVDASRPRVKRDHDHRIVNTFLRTGKRWPPKGTRYLAGELLAHVVRAR